MFVEIIGTVAVTTALQGRTEVVEMNRKSNLRTEVDIAVQQLAPVGFVDEPDFQMGEHHEEQLANEGHLFVPMQI
ncbi:hypothetical protein V6N11_006120 [Hibiscus sabdariffa]|uniref:Uncharacterized protein n=1 Tax=Hibiscus sabdariffa TaxID=183260 RepID=A0ABR2RPV4_9ROSI